MTDTEPATEPRVALYHDAVEADRRLRREYREYYRSDPKGFRDTVRRAHARVFRMKPGPKPERNLLIEKAARKRGSGVPWRDLCPAYIEHYGVLTAYTRGLAEDGFRRKVNQYLRNHPRLKSHARTAVRNSES